MNQLDTQPNITERGAHRPDKRIAMPLVGTPTFYGLIAHERSYALQEDSDFLRG